VGFDDPAGRTWRGGAAGRAASPLGALFGKNGDDHVRVAPPPGGSAAPPPWRIEVIGAVKSRSAASPSTGHTAARPASLIERDTSNASPHERQQNA
jgi:hypothetical protein